MGKTAAASTLILSHYVNRLIQVSLTVALSLTLLNDLSSVSLWSVNKKKPLSTVKQAHGCHGDAGLEQPHWVASVAALQNSDTVASGASGCESPPYQLFNSTHTLTPICALN